jgi:hypothetical protein
LSISNKKYGYKGTAIPFFPGTFSFLQDPSSAWKSAIRCLGISAALLIAGCAKQGYPPGGPLDKTGPRVVEAHPANQAVGMAPDLHPWIRLNEYPQRLSVPDAVFISPDLEGGFTFKIRGKRIEIIPKKDLPRRRTIVITWGTGLKDINGNPMEAPFIHAFSTGDSLDRAVVRGAVADPGNLTSVWMWAYPLDELPNPDPRRDKAPFAVQSDQEGRFTFSYLPARRFRIFAVEDLKPDRLWDSRKEKIAFPSRDVTADSAEIPYLAMKMGLCDLTPPQLIGAQAVHRQTILLTFDEAVDAAQMEITAATDSASGAIPLQIINRYQPPADSACVLLTTARQRDGDVYFIRVDGAADRSANRADSLTIQTPAAAAEDTLGPVFTYSDPPANAEEVNPDAAIRIGFSEAVLLSDLRRAVTIQDSAGASVAGNWTFPGPALGVFLPDPPLQQAMRYTVSIYGDSLRDALGNFCADSLTSFSFRTLDLENTGGISGRINRFTPDLNVVAESIEKRAKIYQTKATQGEAQFRFTDLPSGLYRLWLYQDADRNEHFSYGGLDPFRFAEPFVLHPDTVRVRPRWETENIRLEWPPQTP